MKYRILGVIVVVVVLALVCLFGKSLVFPNGDDATQQQNRSTPSDNSGFKF